MTIWIQRFPLNPAVCFTFLFFFSFFLLSCISGRKEKKFTVYETNVTVYILFRYCLCTVYGTHNHFIQKKKLKMGLMILFTYLKIILLYYFQFLIFSFSKNKSNPNGPNNNKLSASLFSMNLGYNC